MLSWKAKCWMSTFKIEMKNPQIDLDGDLEEELDLNLHYLDR